MLRLILLLLTFLVGTDAAFAGCSTFGRTPTITTPTLLAIYDPTRTSDTVVTSSFTITPPDGMNPPCSLYVVVPQNFNPGMTKNGSMSGPALNYKLGGDLSLAIGFGKTSNLMVNLTPGTSQTFSATMTIPNRQNVPQGNYADAPLEFFLFETNGAALSNFNFANIGANVIASCSLPPPCASQLNFTAGIVNGMVKDAYTLSTFIQNASCSGPAQLILRGGPMKGALPGTATFDANIHYRATARLGAATTILATDVATEAKTNLGPTSGTVSVDVALINKGKPLVAGTYNSILSIVLEPAN